MRLLLESKTVDAAAALRLGLVGELDVAHHVHLLTVDRDRRLARLRRQHLRPLLARPLESWRDQRACRYREEELAKVVMRVGEGEVELTRTMQPGAESEAAIKTAEQLGLTVIANGPCVLVALRFKEEA